MKTIKFLMIIGVVSFALYSFNSIDQDEWVVPANYEKMQKLQKTTLQLENHCIQSIVSHVMVPKV